MASLKRKKKLQNMLPVAFIIGAVRVDIKYFTMMSVCVCVFLLLFNFTLKCQLTAADDKILHFRENKVCQQTI